MQRTWPHCKKKKNKKEKEKKKKKTQHEKGGKQCRPHQLMAQQHIHHEAD